MNNLIFKDMDDFVRFVHSNKEQIVTELYNWARTFDFEFDEEDEPTSISLDAVWRLAERLEKGLCTKKDYKEIEFHIYQMNYDEIVIGHPPGVMPS